MKITILIAICFAVVISATPTQNAKRIDLRGSIGDLDEQQVRGRLLMTSHLFTLITH